MINKQNKKSHFAFTLAEVLITLTIIGVVAAFTIPVLMSNTEEKQTIAKLQKFYSMMSQATASVVNENGGDIIGLPVTGWSNNSLITYFYPYLKTVSQCTYANTIGNCWHANNNYYKADGTPTSPSPSAIGAILPDGALIIFQDVYPNCTGSPYGGSPITDICDWVNIDLNGFKSPNTYGKDIFTFYITKNRFIPRGIKGDYMPECMYGTENFCPANLLLK